MIESDLPGFKAFTLKHKMGMRLATTGRLEFKNYRIPKTQLLGEVVTNLVKNAGEACEGNGTVMVRAAPNNDHVFIEVMDSGQHGAGEKG